MNARLIVNLSLLGLFAGGLNTLGVTAGYDWVIWVGFWFFAGFILRKKVVDKFFIHSFLTGVLFTVFAYLVQVLMLDMYLANNPAIVETLKSFGQDLHPRTYFLSIGLIMAVGNGFILGLIAIGLQKLNKS